MTTDERVQRVRIYMSEHDQWEQRPLYLALIERLQREGATGATALQGTGGFGPGQRGRPGAMPGGMHGGGVPIVIEWVDRAERIMQILPLLDDMLPESLITLEPVEIYRAVLRSRGAFSGDLAVRDIMNDSPQTVTEGSTLGRAIALMLSAKQSILPVLNEQQHIVGVITELDIFRRGGLKVPLRLLPHLTKEEGNTLLSPIASRSVASVLSKEWWTVQEGAYITQALVFMLEWNYDQIPVLNRDNVMIGLVSWTNVLSAVTSKAESDNSNVRDADQPTPVSLVMQSNIPRIEHTQSLGVALQRLLESPDRYLVVVDSSGKVRGSISDVGVFRQLTRSDEREPLISAIQNETPLDVSRIPNTKRSLDVLLEQTPTIAPDETIVDVIHRLMDLRLERAPVVDEDGKLQGLIARGGLLRALAQETT